MMGYEDEEEEQPKIKIPKHKIMYIDLDFNKPNSDPTISLERNTSVTRKRRN